MSIQAVAWVLEESLASYSERLVLIAIANHVGPTGWAWPGIDAIASEAFVDRSTVFRAIDKLVDMGELTVQKRPGKTSLYGLTALLGGSQSATPKGSQSATPGVASARLRGRNLQPEPKRTVSEPNARAHTRGADCWRLAETPALDTETRQRGAEFFRNLRTGNQTKCSGE